MHVANWREGDQVSVCERERESDDVNKGERERALVLSNIESNSDYFISSY